MALPEPVTIELQRVLSGDPARYGATTSQDSATYEIFWGYHTTTTP